MGYANGFADAQSDMFFEDVLPEGADEALKTGLESSFGSAIQPSSRSDRDVFRVLSANGSVVHFMKASGSYSYKCKS